MNRLVEKALYVVLAITIISCASVAPMLPSASELQWTSYNNDRMGISLSVPTDFLVQEYEGDIFFRYHDRVALRITLTTTEDARKRGLWPISSPVADLTVAGHSAQEYVYDHYDGPVFDHFVAYVFDYQGQSLAVAFHTEQNELNSAQEQILNSLIFKAG